MEKDARLVKTEEGLFLESDGQMIQGDLSKMAKRIQKNVLGSELLVKAAKLKNAGEHPIAIDMTAGLGEDSILLAAAGYSVKMYERDPVIADLLEDAVRRARFDERVKEAASNMELIKGDSIDGLKNLGFEPDIIYMDPMFPEREKSGLVKKKFQLIHILEAPCMDEEAMLHAAIAANPRRIIIKRPAKGPFLAGKKPSYSIEGKTIRYDCIVVRA